MSNNPWKRMKLAGEGSHKLPEGGWGTFLLILILFIIGGASYGIHAYMDLGYHNLWGRRQYRDWSRVSATAALIATIGGAVLGAGYAARLWFESKTERENHKNNNPR